jgi:DNA replication protein
VPVEYHSVALELLRPRTDRHWRQADLVAQIQKAPNESYVFSGDFGTGKSHFFWALCVEAVRARKKLFAGTLKALVNHYHESIEASRRGEIYLLPIYPDDFRGKDQCALFLDDLDKARPTEFVVEQLFELLDAAVSNKHQIVVTTNLSPDALITHFERADTTGRFGGSIVRRLLHNSTLIDMF